MTSSFVFFSQTIISTFPLGSLATSWWGSRVSLTYLKSQTSRPSPSNSWTRPPAPGRNRTESVGVPPVRSRSTAFEEVGARARGIVALPRPNDLPHHVDQICRLGKHRRDQGIALESAGIVEEQPHLGRLAFGAALALSGTGSSAGDRPALTRGSIAPSIASTNAMAAATPIFLAKRERSPDPRSHETAPPGIEGLRKQDGS